MVVDVVIVNWNGGSELVAAVTSALRFGGRPIVVDNASTEVKALIDASQLPGVTVIRQPSNTGFAAGCNSGAAAGTGDVVLLLNPDAEILEGTAADLERMFKDSPAMIMALPLEHSANRRLRTISPLPRTRNVLADLVRLHSLRGRLGMHQAAPIGIDDLPGKVGWVVGSALAMRRTDWERIGGLDGGFFLWYEDVDLGARVARAGGTVALADGVRVRHMGASTWVRLPRRRRQWLRVRGAWRYARRHFGWTAAASVAAVAPIALALGAALDVVHWLARRP